MPGFPVKPHVFTGVTSITPLQTNEKAALCRLPFVCNPV